LTLKEEDERVRKKCSTRIQSVIGPKRAHEEVKYMKHRQLTTVSPRRP